MKTSSQPVLDHDAALSAYFDAMLDSPEAAAPEQAAAADTAAEAVVRAEETAAAPAEAPAPVAPTAAASVDEVAQITETAPSTESAAQAAPAGHIRAVLFEVAGLTLALPMDKVKAVVPAEGAFQPVGDPASLLLGVYAHEAVASNVVDTARLVLPPERAGQLAQDPSERSAELVIVGDGRWSLACRRSADVVDLDPAAIKWRTAAGKRPWLAGMATDHKCALLDAEGLVQLLNDQMA